MSTHSRDLPLPPFLEPQVAGHGPAAAADVSIPMVGQTLTLMLDLSRYVVLRGRGALTLVNEALLLSNLNENVLGRYGLRASRVHADASKQSAKGLASGLAGLRGRTLLVVSVVVAVAAVAVAAAATRARRKA